MIMSEGAVDNNNNVMNTKATKNLKKTTKKERKLKKKTANDAADLPLWLAMSIRFETSRKPQCGVQVIIQMSSQEQQQIKITIIRNAFNLMSCFQPSRKP